MTKKGFTRVKRVLAATIKNSGQVDAVIGYLKSLRIDLEMAETERSILLAWDALSPKAGDVIFKHRSSGKSDPFYGKALTISHVMPRAKRICFGVMWITQHEVLLGRYSKDVPIKAFELLCEKGKEKS